MENAIQYNISTQTKIEDGISCERSEHHMEDTIENNSIFCEDNSNKNTDSIIGKINNNENSLHNDENNKEDELSNNKGLVEPSDEHTQRSRYHSLYYISINQEAIKKSYKCHYFSEFALTDNTDNYEKHAILFHEEKNLYILH
jgi:hypothetical protein